MSKLLHTPLYDLHRQQGARLVPFAGFEMPVQFAGIVAEHTHTRTAASLFDVSHMGQVFFKGRDAEAALEKLLPSRLDTLKVGQSRYSVLLNEAGGIVDDVIVTRCADGFAMVINGARREADLTHFKKYLTGDVCLETAFDRALLAVQGPQAVEAVSRLCPEVATLAYMHGTAGTIAGVPVWVSRSGYTGEDGLEISVPGADAQKVAKLLLDTPPILNAGLGARDSLRLEAGLPLYGHDLDETTSPFETGIGWIVSKEKLEKGSFLGAARLQREKANGAPRRRVALFRDDRQIVREGATVHTAEGKPVGMITSGSFGVTCGKAVALALIEASALSATTFVVRYRDADKVFSVWDKLPFVPNRTIARCVISGRH
ncbi:MAG: glycine cleavage system aminomethyltransferase GcvT [Holosporales bacterium]|jgi:aminomethyltransferase